MVVPLTESTRDEMNQPNTKRAKLFVIPDPANNKTHRWTDWSEKVEFPEGSGNVYDPFPVRLDDIKKEQGGQIQKVTVTVSTINKAIVKSIFDNDGLHNEEIEVYEVNLNSLATEADAISHEIFLADGPTFDVEKAQMRLFSVLDKLHVSMGEVITREKFPDIPKDRTIIR